MKHIIFSFMILSCTVFHCVAQQPGDKQKLIQYKITKKRITAVEYNNGIEVKKRFHVEAYDHEGNATKYTSYDETGKIYLFDISEISNGGLKKEVKQFNGDRVLQNINIYILDNMGRTREYYQLSSLKDTLVSEKRYFDKNGRDSLLYTKTKQSGKYEITGQWEYDRMGNLTTSRTASGKVRHIKDTLSGCDVQMNHLEQIIGKTCTINNEVIDYFYQDHIDHLYGIAVHSKNGGRRITRFNDMHLESEMVYENKKGKVLARITYSYE